FVLEDLGCARGVVDQRSKSKAVVFTRAETKQNTDGTRDIAVTGYWFQKDHDAISERRVCERCNDEKLHETVDDLMLSLVHEPPPPLASKPALVEEPVAESNPRWVPLGIMAFGGGALLAGGIMIAIDQDPNPVGRQEPNLHDTATFGVVLG